MQRIQLSAGKTREVTVGEPIGSVIVIDPEIATAEIKGDRTVVIAGLMSGSTILIISGKNSRTTYAVDVERPIVLARPKTDDERRVAYPQLSAGSSTVYFTPGLSGAPSVLRYNFEFTRKLTNDRTLRISSEMFRFFGRGDRAFVAPLGISFGASRLKVGLDSPTTRLDVLDSELAISPLSFNGYTLRGPHFKSTPESRWHGIEIFAGNARPQLTLFNKGEGRLAGAIIPIVSGKSLRIRSGIFFVAPSHNPENLGPNSAKGGLVLHADVRYAPDDRTNAEGELAYGNGGLSWRARLDVRRGPFNFNGELSHLDTRSPMIAIGAQAGGRTRSAFSLQWQPNSRFHATISYNRIINAPIVGSGRVQLNSREIVFSANYHPTGNTRLGLSVNQQMIGAAPATVPFVLNLQSRSAVLTYDQRINRHWSNNLEVRLIQSREANTDSQMNRGFSMREQLRFTWRRGSVVGFVNYRGNTSSLESLVLRNPQLLPVEFRAAFAADPQRFFQVNRDALPLLLNGIQLPLTRNSEAGVRFQAALLSRLNVAADITYSVGKLVAGEQRTLAASFSANLRIDAANSVQVSASRALDFNGRSSHTGITVSYTHRFGASSGGGFQFSGLLGTGRGRIQGHVFMDLNSNGYQDPDELGIAGMKVQLDGSKSVVTDSRGDFSFRALDPGDFDVALISDQLGITLRASSATSQHVSLAPNQTVNLNFGLTSNGFVGGRVFNDLLLRAEPTAGAAPGLAGVKLILRAADGNRGSKPTIQIADGNGGYDFRNLAPGKYILEVDPHTLPENFRLPVSMTWLISISPLQGFYLDIPFAAQRAISGIVYIDRDANGKYDSEKDLTVKGARVVFGKSEAWTSQTGSYLLRNLPAGKVDLQVYVPGRNAQTPLRLELGSDPSLRTGVNLRIE